MEDLKVHSKPLRTFYLWSGIIATLAYRVIIVLTDTGTFWVKLSWYIGTVGFIIYFIHRYQLSEKRAEIIKKYNLEEKTRNLELSSEDKEAMTYIFHSLKVSSEKIVFIVIFISSALALLAGIYLDFFK